jgi:hypothetical protein
LSVIFPFAESACIRTANELMNTCSRTIRRA